MFDTLSSQIGAVLMVLVCGFAFWKGDEPEKVGAAAYILAWFGSLLVQSDNNLYGTQWGMFAIDVVVLGVFALLSWKASRAWAVWAAALQTLVVMSHVLTIIDLRPAVAAYFTVIILVSYGVLVCLAIGTFWVWQERRAAGLE